MRILIADADRNFLESFQSYMWDCGHDAELATSGLECSAILYRFIPDVLIIERDLLWGGCDGILAKMRDSADLSRIPVIILESDPDETGADLASPNIVARMEKPYHMRETLEQILSAVGPLHPGSDNGSRDRPRSLSH
jgi:DNA-binding response OmpR family regulator